jgi:hypothetical protein
MQQEQRFVTKRGKRHWFRRIGRPLLFFALLICAFSIFTDIFHAKSVYGGNVLEKFYNGRPQTVDVLVLGSSHAFTSVNPAVLYDEFGIAAFDLGGGRQPMWNSYYYLVEALKTQTPKVVVLEGYHVIFTPEYVDRSTIINNNFGLKLSGNMLNALRASVPPNQFFDYLLRFDRYHTRYRNLGVADFQQQMTRITASSYESGKGFLGMGGQQSVEPLDDILEKREPLDEKVEQYYRKIFALCEARGIPLEIIVTPWHVSDESQTLLNTAEDIAHSCGVAFTNYNSFYNELGIDFATDLVDVEHLNYKGAEKLTRALGERLKARYDLPDRRGDSAWDSWAQDARLYRRFAKGRELIETDNFDLYWAAVADDPDWTLCVVYDGTGGEQAAALLSRIGVTDPEAYGVWVMRNGACIAATSSTRSYIDLGSVTVDMRDTTAVLLNSEPVQAPSGGVTLIAYDSVADCVIDQAGIDGWAEAETGAVRLTRP